MVDEKISYVLMVKISYIFGLKKILCVISKVALLLYMADFQV
jgi:hypothetical protein